MWISGYINLLKTAMGSGILSFPFLFKIYGIIPSIILSCFFGIITLFGLIIYQSSTTKYYPNISISSLSSLCWSKLGFIVDVAIFLKCLGVASSYLIVVRQLLPLILKYFKVKFIPNSILIVGFVILISPMCYFKRLDKLKFTSFIGLVAIWIILASSIYRYSIKTEYSKSNLFKKFSLDWIDNLGKFVFAFTFHMNYFTIYNELGDNANRYINKISFFVVLSAFLTYTTFGFSNYVLYEDLVHDDVLENFPNDILAQITRILYIIVMAFSYPLQINPCRIYFINILNIRDTELKDIIGYVITTVVIFFSASIAISGLELGIVYKIIGATSSTLMSLILPAIFYYKLESNKNLLKSLGALILFVVGTFIFAYTTIRLLV